MVLTWLDYDPPQPRLSQYQGESVMGLWDLRGTITPFFHTDSLPLLVKTSRFPVVNKEIVKGCCIYSATSLQRPTAGTAKIGCCREMAVVRRV